jgi:lipoate-protein ligase A
MSSTAQARQFRVIDTGIREGRRQIAFDQALIDAHKAGRIPDTIRFLRFPPTVLVGRHQVLSREVKLDYCRSRGIGVGRRITGGGALYLDEGQFGWELVFKRSTLGMSSLAELAREICEAAASGLSKLGVDARYRPRNDIEIDGRKVSGTGGFFDDDTLFYQGTVLVDMNPAEMVAALNVPAAKLAKRAMDSAEQRVVTLRELLGDVPPHDIVKQALLDGFSERFGIEAMPGEITQYEEELAASHYDDEIGTDAFVHDIDEPDAQGDVLVGSHMGAGGTVTAYVRLEGIKHDRIREVLLTGDFFVTPPRTVFDLEAALRNVHVSDVASTIEHFFGSARIGLLTLSPDDFSKAIGAALEGSAVLN